MAVTEAEVPVVEAEQPHESLWQWNQWVHVGPGAETCDHATDAACPLEKGEVPVDRRHFHAWCRLPNQFAYRDINVKAQAARARKTRQLRDPDSDSAIILEDELDALRETPSALIAEINASKFGDLEEAESQVRESEEGEDKEFEHIEQDRAELARLALTSEDERDEDAYESLRRHVEKFASAVEECERRIKDRRRESLEGESVDELVDQVRKIRIERIGINEYLHVSNFWSWYVGTMDGEGSDRRKFSDINRLTSAPGEVIHALQVAFSELEAHFSPVGPGKNS